VARTWACAHNRTPPQTPVSRALGQKQHNMSYPEIIAVSDVEKIRDGGSYTANVVDENGDEYLLYIGVKLRDLFSEKWKLKCFQIPELRKTEDDSVIEIDWNYCKKILSLPNNIESEIRLGWLSEMKKVAKKSGSAPVRMKLCGPWRKLR